LCGAYQLPPSFTAYSIHIKGNGHFILLSEADMGLGLIVRSDIWGLHT
jgi:hypothetical protein